MTPLIVTALVMLQSPESPEDAITVAQADIEAAFARREANMNRRFDGLDMQLSSLLERLMARPKPGDPPGVQHR